MADLQHIKIMCFGQDTPSDHPDFFAHDSGKILLQIGTDGAAFLRAAGFEPEMVCGPNVLAMTSPCDNAHALDRLAEVLHALDFHPGHSAPTPPAHLLPAPGNAACTIAEALLCPARQVPMTLADACGKTAVEYIWAYPPGVPLVAPGEEITPEFLTACQAQDCTTVCAGMSGASLFCNERKAPLEGSSRAAGEGWPGVACNIVPPSHPSVTFGDSAPLLELRATSPVPGESVLKGSLLPVQFCVTAKRHGRTMFAPTSYRTFSCAPCMIFPLTIYPIPCTINIILKCIKG